MSQPTERSTAFADAIEGEVVQWPTRCIPGCKDCLDGARRRVGKLVGAWLQDFISDEEFAYATYLGGYSTPEEIKIFHHGMSTVFNMLRSARRNLNDSEGA